MNTTKTRGDILAERIDQILKPGQPWQPLAKLREALAEYRTIENKPILTPAQIAEGWREWLGGECPVWGGSSAALMFSDGTVTHDLDLKSQEYCWLSMPTKANIIAYLPDPYEALKKAHAEGKVIQCCAADDRNHWMDLYGTFDHWSLRPDEYRVKPEPVMVPLGPDDVPPGSALGHDSTGADWSIVTYVTQEIVGTHFGVFTYKELMGWKIHRPGAYDADGKPLFVRCQKPQEGGK